MITHCDPSDLPQASITDHPADHCLEAYCDRCAAVVDAVCPKCKGNVSPTGAALTTKDGAAESSLTRPEFYRRFLHLFGAARNPKFLLACYYMATGDGYADGVSMTDVAKQFGVGKAAVSQKCVAICAYLGLPPSRYMMKKESAAKFRGSNRRPNKQKN